MHRLSPGAAEPSAPWWARECQKVTLHKQTEASAVEGGGACNTQKHPSAGPRHSTRRSSVGRPPPRGATATRGSNGGSAGGGSPGREGFPVLEGLVWCVAEDPEVPIDEPAMARAEAVVWVGSARHARMGLHEGWVRESLLLLRLSFTCDHPHARRLLPHMCIAAGAC